MREELCSQFALNQFLPSLPAVPPDRNRPNHRATCLTCSLESRALCKTALTTGGRHLAYKLISKFETEVFKCLLPPSDQSNGRKRQCFANAKCTDLIGNSRKNDLLTMLLDVRIEVRLNCGTGGCCGAWPKRLRCTLKELSASLSRSSGVTILIKSAEVVNGCFEVYLLKAKFRAFVLFYFTFPVCDLIYR